MNLINGILTVHLDEKRSVELSHTKWLAAEDKGEKWAAHAIAKTKFSELAATHATALITRFLNNDTHTQPGSIIYNVFLIQIYEVRPLPSRNLVKINWYTKRKSGKFTSSLET